MRIIYDSFGKWNEIIIVKRELTGCGMLFSIFQLSDGFCVDWINWQHINTSTWGAIKHAKLSIVIDSAPIKITFFKKKLYAEIDKLLCHSFLVRTHSLALEWFYLFGLGMRAYVRAYVYVGYQNSWCYQQ